MVGQSEGSSTPNLKLTRPLDGRKYIRNLGNTTLTVLLSIPLMTALYFFIWYPQLNGTLMEVSQDIVVSNISLYVKATF